MLSGSRAFCANLIKSFAKCKLGQSAVEFAVVSGPYLFLVGAIIEMELLAVSSNSLQSAVTIAGDALGNNTINSSPTAFRDAICDNLLGIMPCNDALTIDVRVVGELSEFNMQSAVQETFSDGNPGDMLLVRITYHWNTIFPGIAFGMDLYDDKGGLLYASTAVFRSE